MKYSDDKTIKDGEHTAVEPENKSSINADADGIVAPSLEEPQKVVAPSNNQTELEANSVDGKTENGRSFTGELVSVAVKAVAVALSVILLLTCILAVAMPLSTMRIFNKLGMSARAVDFGERYINRELNSYSGTYNYTDEDDIVRTGTAKASHTDGVGNYDVLGRTPALTNDDFMEAIYVCTNLSYNMMEEYYKAGDKKSGEYYAERVEKYTRMYLSLSDVNVVNAKKSESNINSMPLIALRPYVYSYGHDIRVMNFRARAWLNKTEYAMNAISSGVDRLTVLNATFWGLNIPNDKSAAEQVLDNYVDYISCLSEYLDVEFLRAGVENDLSKSGKAGERENVPVMSEAFVGSNYLNVLSGDGFSLFVTRTDGFTPYFEFLKARLHDYFQAAVDYTPDDRINNKLDEQLHQLYWLQAMSDIARKLWYMGMLINYSREQYGSSMSTIKDEYSDNTFSNFQFVKYNGRQMSIWEVYDVKLAQYTSQYLNK